jgi:uncharacterized protein (DUF2235 family)
MTHVPKNVVLCCDGTDNKFGARNTNVVRLVQALERDEQTQVVYYDPGIGTMPQPSFADRWKARLNNLLDSAFATGLASKVETAYTHLMEVWEPGDRIFLYGFSRGAYTVRVLAGMLHQIGLLPRGSENLVPYAMQYFGALRAAEDDQHSAQAKAYFDLCDQFRETFARVVPHRSDRSVPVHFLGVWDTVSSVGWLWEPQRYPFSSHNPSIEIVRHAVSIDERRCMFRQNLFGAVPGQDLGELWFPGVHSDIGGGYSEADGGLWQAPFDWIVAESVRAGLLVRQASAQSTPMESSATRTPWNDTQHESLRGFWWLAELFPKMVWQSTTSRSRPMLGLGRHRHVHPGALMHWSALRRMRETGYRPSNLPPAFIQSVLNGAAIEQPFLATPIG